MTYGKKLYTIAVKVDNEKILEIKTNDYRDGIRKARKACGEKLQ